MPILTLDELIQIDPVTAADDAFEGWTLASAQPIIDRAEAAYRVAYDLGHAARQLTNQAKTVFGQWRQFAAPTPDAPGVDRQAETRRGEVHLMRIWLQSLGYFESLVAAVRAAPNDFNRWPSIPPYIEPQEKPRFVPIGKPLDIHAWCAERVDVLTDPRRVRAQRGKLYARGFSDDDVKVMKAWERTIADFISYQFEAVSPLVQVG